MANLEYENGSSIPDSELPSAAQFDAWLSSALPAKEQTSQVCLRIMDEDEIQSLNSQFRHKNTATNVLSFPCDLPEGVDAPLLGDLAICAQVVKREAAEQNKEELAHWAHMVVHGALHLLGYDHINDHDAKEMESLETEILVKFGFPPPYADEQ